MTLVVWLILAAPALAALSLTLFNVAAWPRGREEPRSGEVVPTSILIPARNEEATIEAAVRSALAQDPLEVLVYDDQSTDETPRILRRAREEDPRLRVVPGRELPAGWVGKPHACHRLSEEARGDLLFFMDADVELAEGGLARLGSILEDYGADAVTAVPRQSLGSWFERLVLPMLHVTYVSWLPIPLVWRSRDPRFLAANGQLLAVRRTAYEAVGGFAAVRDAVVDDMEFCRALKRTGKRVVFADGHRVASCRMYGSAGEVWSGFSKNIYEGVGSAALLALVIALYLTAFVAPWIALLVSPLAPSLLVPAAVGVGANVLQRLVLAARHGHPLWGVLFHPLAVLSLIAIALNSWRWHLRGAIEWSGRSYAQKESRDA